MKQYPAKEKIVNGQDDQRTGQDDAKQPAVKNKEKGNNKSKLTTADLKGKKVDGDPELESDQPVKQVY